MSSTINQPTANAAALGFDQAPLLQRAQHHDGAGDRQRKAEHERSPDRPSEQPSRAIPSAVAQAIWITAPGITMARTASNS